MELLVLAIVLFAALLLIPLGLPGTWVMIAAAMGYGYLAGEGIGFPTLVMVFGLAIVGEVIEFTLAARYTRKYGGSRRAGWGAIVGGIIGAIVGVPVPIIGSVIGAFAGAFLGALVAERTRGVTTGDATRVATGALIGRAAAVAAKSAIGVAIAALILLSAWRATMREGGRTIDVGALQGGRVAVPHSLHELDHHPQHAAGGRHRGSALSEHVTVAPPGEFAGRSTALPFG